VLAAGVDLVFTVGREMENLDRALPPARLGGHAATSAELRRASRGGAARRRADGQGAPSAAAWPRS